MYIYCPAFKCSNGLTYVKYALSIVDGGRVKLHIWIRSLLTTWRKLKNNKRKIDQINQIWANKPNWAGAPLLKRLCWGLKQTKLHRSQNTMQLCLVEFRGYSSWTCKTATAQSSNNSKSVNINWPEGCRPDSLTSSQGRRELSCWPFSVCHLQLLQWLLANSRSRKEWKTVRWKCRKLHVCIQPSRFENRRWNCLSLFSFTLGRVMLRLLAHNLIIANNQSRASHPWGCLHGLLVGAFYSFTRFHATERSVTNAFILYGNVTDSLQYSPSQTNKSLPWC